jgi:hemerythrin
MPPPLGRLARPLHEAQPWLLMAAGLAAACAPAGLARACGGVLAAAGVALLALRVRYRRRAMAEAAARHAPAGRPSRLASTTARVRAILPPPTGHLDVDRQHRALATLSASLLVALEMGDASADVALLLADLQADLEEHFALERAVLRRLGLEDSVEDRRAESALTLASRSLVARERDSQLALESAVRRMGELVAGHLLRPHPSLSTRARALERLRDRPRADLEP